MKLNTLPAIIFSSILIGLLVDMIIDLNYNVSLVRYIMESLK